MSQNDGLNLSLSAEVGMTRLTRQAGILDARVIRNLEQLMGSFGIRAAALLEACNREEFRELTIEASFSYENCRVEVKAFSPANPEPVLAATSFLGVASPDEIRLAIRNWVVGTLLPRLGSR